MSGAIVGADLDASAGGDKHLAFLGVTNRLGTRIVLPILDVEPQEAFLFKRHRKTFLRIGSLGAAEDGDASIGERFRRVTSSEGIMGQFGDNDSHTQLAGNLFTSEIRWITGDVVPVESEGVSIAPGNGG